MKQSYGLSERQLEKLVWQGTYPGAGAICDQVRAIREAGRVLKRFYSEFNGFTVFNDNDVESMNRLRSIESRAKSFPG